MLIPLDSSKDSWVDLDKGHVINLYESKDVIASTINHFFSANGSAGRVFKTKRGAKRAMMNFINRVNEHECENIPILSKEGYDVSSMYEVDQIDEEE